MHVCDPVYKGTLGRRRTLVNPDFPDILYIECPREMIISIGNCNFTLRFRTNRDAGFHPAAFFPLAVVSLAFGVEIARSSSLLWLSQNVSSIVRGKRAIKFFARPVLLVFDARSD